MYSLAVIVIARCLCWPPLKFDAMDAAFPLINRCILISASLVCYPPIFVSMGVGKSDRTPSPFFVAPAISSRDIGKLDGRFFP